MGPWARCVHERVPWMAPRKDPGSWGLVSGATSLGDCGPSPECLRLGLAVHGMEGGRTGPAALESHLGSIISGCRCFLPAQTPMGSKTLASRGLLWLLCPGLPPLPHPPLLGSGAPPSASPPGDHAPGQPLPCLFPATLRRWCLLSGPHAPFLCLTWCSFRQRSERSAFPPGPGGGQPLRCPFVA